MEGKLDLTFVFEEDCQDGGFAGICLELNVASEGDTLEEAKVNLWDAVKLYLAHAIESGRFDEMVPRPVPDYLRSKLKKGKKVDTVRPKIDLLNSFPNFPDILGRGSGSTFLHA